MVKLCEFLITFNKKGIYINNKPLFTVIIPTKDRAEYLTHTLNTCVMQEYENFEIIVSDDGSSDNTRNIVEKFSNSDSRVRYISPGNNVGMKENFEYALNQVRPGYVMALGGDDGLLPDGISGMWKVLSATNQKLLAWATPLFIYPNTRAKSGQLVLNARLLKFRKDHMILDSKIYLKRQAENLNYVFDAMAPMIYVKGVAHTDLINRVKSRSSDGKFYACSTPDGYSGIVLAGEVDTYAFSHQPFSIHGGTPKSQGVAYLGGDKNKNKQAGEFFNHAKNIALHKKLASQPYSPLISLMTADFLFTAKDLPGWSGEFPDIDIKNLLKKGISELSHGHWSDDRLERELDILYAIAKYHQLEHYFLATLKDKKRESWSQLEGDAISHKRIYLDSAKYEIKNIVDAAYVAHYTHQIFSEFSLLNFFKMFYLSVKHKICLMRKKEHLIRYLKLKK